MSTLQVSNIHFESTGNNRLQYTGSNSFNIVAGGSTVASINTTAISYPLEASLNDTTISGNLAVTGNTTLTGAATFSNTVSITGDTTFAGAIDEKVYNLTGTAIDPSNGTIQYKEIGSNVTLTDSLSEGESVTVMIKSTSPNDTVTWPTTTWVNNGKTAPTIITGDWTVVALWKVSTTLYGALVGDGS